MTALFAPKIDAHQHCWRYQPAQYRWISDQMPVLQQDWLPAQLAHLLQRHKIDASVLVQARASTDETLTLLQMAEQNAFVKAVIGWVDLTSPQLAQQLEQVAHPLLRGFRHLIQDEAQPAAWLENSVVNAGLRQLQQQGYVYEILVTHRHLAEATRFASRHDQHALVLDHLGKPDLSQGADHWRKQIRPLAAMPHVSCKLSGLLTEPRPAGLTLNDLLPFYHAALEVFGPERLLFGSDWPVCLLAGGYDNTLALTEQAIKGLSPDEQAAIWGANACRLYSL